MDYTPIQNIVNNHKCNFLMIMFLRHLALWDE